LVSPQGKEVGLVENSYGQFAFKGISNTGCIGYRIGQDNDLAALGEG
jgi:hypothetical protein